MNKKRTTTESASETDEAAERRRYLTARLERVRIESASWPNPWTEEWKKIKAEGELR
jgi:hypothetical protein